MKVEKFTVVAAPRAVEKTGPSSVLVAVAQCEGKQASRGYESPAQALEA